MLLIISENKIENRNPYPKIATMELTDKFISKLYKIEPCDRPRILYRMLDIVEETVKQNRIMELRSSYAGWIHNIINRYPFPFPKSDYIFKYYQEMPYAEFKDGLKNHIDVKRIISPMGKISANGFSPIKLFTSLLTQINREMDAEMDAEMEEQEMKEQEMHIAVAQLVEDLKPQLIADLKPQTNTQSCQTDEFPPISKEEHDKAFTSAFDLLFEEQKEEEPKKGEKDLHKEIVDMKKDMKEIMRMIHAMYEFETREEK